MLDAYFDEGEREDCFYFLDKLRGSGKTNMVGAINPLRREFGFNRADAKAVLQDWMLTYADRHPK